MWCWAKSWKPWIWAKYLPVSASLINCGLKLDIKFKLVYKCDNGQSLENTSKVLRMNGPLPVSASLMNCGLWIKLDSGPTKPARENLQMQCTAIHDNWVGRGALNQGCVNVHNKVLTADNYNVFNFSTMQWSGSVPPLECILNHWQ